MRTQIKTLTIINFGLIALNAFLFLINTFQYNSYQVSEHLKTNTSGDFFFYLIEGGIVYLAIKGMYQFSLINTETEKKNLTSMLDTSVVISVVSIAICLFSRWKINFDYKVNGLELTTYFQFIIIFSIILIVLHVLYCLFNIVSRKEF